MKSHTRSTGDVNNPSTNAYFMKTLTQLTCDRKKDTR